MNAEHRPIRAEGAIDTADNQFVNAADIWHAIVQFKWLVALITIAGVAVGVAATLVITPKYQADVLASPAEESKGGGLASLTGSFGGVAELAGLSVGTGGGARESAIAYLKSRAFIEDFIKEKNLLPILYSDRWNADKRKWIIDDPKKVPSLWSAYRLFSLQILTVAVDKKSGLITLSVVWKDRDQAVDWANDLIRRANAKLRQKAISEAELSLGYLEKELQKTSVVEVQQAIFRVMESQIKTKMMANVQEQYAFNIIDPAALMDEGAYVKPNRLMLLVLGFVGGGLLGVLAAIALKAARVRRGVV